MENQTFKGNIIFVGEKPFVNYKAGKSNYQTIPLYEGIPKWKFPKSGDEVEFEIYYYDYDEVRDEFYNPYAYIVPTKEEKIKSLLEQREKIEDEIRKLDPMALIHYELERLQSI